MTLRSVSFMVALALGGIGVASPAVAQVRPTMGVRGTYLPLYEGDASTGPFAGWGWGVQAGAAVGPLGQSELEGFYAYVPRSDVGPRIQLAGATFSLTRGVDALVTGVGTLGLGMIAVDGRDAGPACVGFACPFEGPTSIPDARYPMVVLGGGLGTTMADVHVRVDLRRLIPFRTGGSSSAGAASRFELGASVRWVG